MWLFGCVLGCVCAWLVVGVGVWCGVGVVWCVVWCVCVCLCVSVCVSMGVSVCKVCGGTTHTLTPGGRSGHHQAWAEVAKRRCAHGAFR